MDANFRKLQAIEKATGRRQAYSPYVLISKLPPTVMPDDIKRMARSEEDIITIIYHRNDYMDFLGRVTIVFKSATSATEFLTQQFGKFMSGHRLSMTMPHFQDRLFLYQDYL
ncbi:hypothetical protein BGW42_006109 [Actinomortierella wolfii]|nr:hypothetical protein BGW42_006109 [Actinomortierella wolfii]